MATASISRTSRATARGGRARNGWDHSACRHLSVTRSLGYTADFSGVYLARSHREHHVNGIPNVYSPDGALAKAGDDLMHFVGHEGHRRCNRHRGNVVTRTQLQADNIAIVRRADHGFIKLPLSITKLRLQTYN